jgi:DNA-binding IclR family transcriptional regulator
LVPAVDRAVAILRYLQEHADPALCTFSKIAGALELNKSTCSNILRALDEAGMVERERETKGYRLGPELIGLGAAASRHRDFVRVAIRHLEDVVRETGFTAVAFDRLPNGEYVIVAKVESPNEIKATVDLGQHFPAAAPALLRATLAWSDDGEVERYVARSGLPRFTSKTKTKRSELREELARSRAAGFAVSYGEYYSGNLALAAPVFDRKGTARRGICLIAFITEIDNDRVHTIGRAVHRAAQAVTRAIGGSWPELPASQETGSKTSRVRS